MDLGEHVLRYESLVADRDAQARKLFDYIGLPFERVTEKLNDRSIDRHEHYARQLQPYASRLARTMAAHGYA
jgi:hypothetical protein